MKKLTVIIVNKDARFLASAFGALVTEKDRIQAEAGLSNLSILRGDLSFCLTALRKPRDYSVIAIVDKATYADTDQRDSILTAGAALVYNFVGTSEKDLAARVRECVRHFLGQR